MSAVDSTTGGPITFRWLPAISAIDREHWEACFDRDDVMHSYALQQATEAAGLPDVEFHYLVAEVVERVVAVVPCFRFRMSLAAIAPASVNKVVSAVRRVLPGFLYVNVFVAGTPIAICKDLLGLSHAVQDRQREELLRGVLDEVIARAKRLGLRLVLLKELTTRLLPQVRHVLAERFILVESAATTYLYLGEPGHATYRDRLRKKYRSLMNNRQARFAQAGLRWETCVDFSRHAEQMHALYLQVLDRSKVRFETLNPDFFARLCEHLGSSVFALLCFRGEQLVAFELFLEDERWLHPVYLGLDYRYRDEGALYFNCIYKIVELQEARGKSVVQLGQTSYAVKASLGAVVDRLWAALHHTSPPVHLVLKGIAALLFPPTVVPRTQRVFRDMQANDAGLARCGIHFERTDA